MIINGKECEFTNERNILEVIRKNGFNVPTFCYRPDLTKDFVGKGIPREKIYSGGRRQHGWRQNREGNCLISI